MSRSPINRTAWRRLWDSLSAETKAEIGAKAQWEHMSLMAVTREWWPDLWQQYEDFTAAGLEET